MTPHSPPPHFKHPSLLPPLPIHHPPPPPKNFDHTPVILFILQTSLEEFRVFKSGSVLPILGSILRFCIHWDHFCGCTPPPPAPFVFSSPLVEKKKVPLKASTVLNKAAPPLVSSSNSTKSTKNPSLGSQRYSSSKLSPQQNKTSSTKPSPNKPSI